MLPLRLLLLPRGGLQLAVELPQLLGVEGARVVELTLQLLDPLVWPARKTDKIVAEISRYDCM